jgi:hypothetical protein
MASVPLRARVTMLARLSRMSRIAWSRLEWSPAAVSTSTVKSPAAMRVAISAASAGSPPSCLRSPRVMISATSTLAASAAARIKALCQTAAAMRSRAEASSVSERLVAICTRRSITVRCVS